MQQELKKYSDKLSGLIERITYRNEENGWTVLKVSSFDHQSKIIPVVVHQACVVAGETMDFYGEWVNHPKYGEQFKAIKTVSKKPASANALQKYLGSGLIKGVGPKTARTIVKHFKEDTLSVFENEINRLMEVPGIARKKLKMIQDAWEEHKSIKDIMIFLQSNDISTLFAVKIFKQYGFNSIEVVSKNPYCLSKDIYGVGFFTADRIAQNLGFKTDCFERISAGIKHVLASSKEQGHCYLTREQLYKQVKELLSLSELSLIDTPLGEIQVQNEICTRKIDGETQKILYYSKSLYFDELHLANRIKKIMEYDPKIDSSRVRDWLKKYCKKYKFELSSEQAEAVISITGHSISVLTGGPGCGKTTTLRILVRLFEAMNKTVMLAAPTGRAAQRMSEVIGRESKTIHRLLGWNPEKGNFDKNEATQLQTQVLVLDEASMIDISLASALFKAVPDKSQVILIGDPDQLPSVGAGNFLSDVITSDVVHHARLTKIFRQAELSSIVRFAHQINAGTIPVIKSPISESKLWKGEADCLFMDSEEATQDQLKFIKKAKFLLEAKLDKNIWNNKGIEILNNSEENEDFVIPEKYKHVNLEKLLQSKNEAEDLTCLIKKIPSYSTLHYGLKASDTILHLVRSSIPEHYGKNIEIQVLCPMTRGSVGTDSLNTLIQSSLNPYRKEQGQVLIGQRAFRVGDRVIQRVNNYDLNVFNGDIGVIKSLSEENVLIVEFGKGSDVRRVKYERSDMIQLALAYAITIHKSQGSEFPVVVIPILTQHFKMLYRNLIYTGLTRAKKLAVFVGSKKALAIAIKNVDMKTRQTTLKRLLKNEF